MTVLSSSKDLDTLTLTMVAEFDATPESVWGVWEDPRKLERWWGPPTWPATFERHDFTVGGDVGYYMTGPNGERAYGWWRFTAIDEPKSLEFDEGFAHDASTPNHDMPTMRMRVDIEPAGDVTRMTVTTFFRDAAEMTQLSEMGMVEGMEGAAGQIDAILAA